MNRGKQTCRILKDIRRQIAEANGIEFTVSECRYKGDCLGTCPKCEAEVRYLEQALERRRLAGKAVVLIGVSAGLLAASSAAVAGEAEAETAASPPVVACRDSVSADDIVVVTGRVVDTAGCPIQGVVVLIEGTLLGTATDSTGYFTLSAPNRDKLIFSYVGYETQKIRVRRAAAADLLVVMREETFVMGEMPLVNVVSHYSESIRRVLAGQIRSVKIEESPEADGVAVQGVVVDKEGRYLEGVEILQIGEDSATLVDQTDEYGQFDTRVVLRRKRFMIAKEGYKSKKIRVGRRKNPQRLFVVMKLRRPSSSVEAGAD